MEDHNDLFVYNGRSKWCICLEWKIIIVYLFTMEDQNDVFFRMENHNDAFV